jgi:hypothetical protein
VRILAAFERNMRERMLPLVEQAVATQDILFADDAPAGLVSLFEARKNDAQRFVSGCSQAADQAASGVPSR